MSRWEMKGRNVLVTGGTRGIGRGIVEELAGLGARVFTCGRDEATLEERLAEWNSRGLGVQGAVCDVAEEEQRTALVAEVRKVFVGGLQGLVNNAGTNLRKPAIEYTRDDYQHVLDLNIRAAFHLTQLCHPLLAAGQPSSIVMISSIGAEVALQEASLYSMSKAALSSLSRSLAMEFAADGIRVNALLPGYIDTELAMGAIQKNNLLGQIQARQMRMGDPQEIGSIAAFLCMPAASFVTGQSIAADFGYLINGNFDRRSVQ